MANARIDRLISIAVETVNFADRPIFASKSKAENSDSRFYGAWPSRRRVPVHEVWSDAPLRHPLRLTGKSGSTDRAVAVRGHRAPNDSISASFSFEVVAGTTATKGSRSIRAKLASEIAVLPEEASTARIPSRR